MRVLKNSEKITCLWKNGIEKHLITIIVWKFSVRLYILETLEHIWEGEMRGCFQILNSDYEVYLKNDCIEKSEFSTKWQDPGHILMI